MKFLQGCGACMGCVSDVGCMNSFGLHGVGGMGRMVRSFDTLGAPLAPKPSVSTLDLSWGKLLSLVEEIRQQALASKDIVGTLKQAIASPKLLKPYADAAPTVSENFLGVSSTFKPWLKSKTKAGKATPEELRDFYFKYLTEQIYTKPKTEQIKDAQSFLVDFFNVLQLILIPPNARVHFYVGLIRTKPQPKNATIYVPEKVPLQLYLDKFYQLLQSQSIDYSTGLPMPQASISKGGMGPAEGVRLPIKQVAMSDQQGADASNQSRESAKQTQSLSGTQIGLIAVGGIGILGAAWYFMSKKKG